MTTETRAKERRTLPAPQLEQVPWRAVVVFVVAAIGLAWLVALPLWVETSFVPPFTLVAMAMMFTPLLAVLVVTFVMRTPRTDRARFLGLWPLRPAARTVWLTVAAIFVPPLLVAVVVFVSAALGLVQLDLVGFSGFRDSVGPALAQAGVDPATVPVEAMVFSQLAMIPLAALVNSVVAFGEEIGWRGWLVPALRPLGVWPALVLSGAVWGLWHAPLILLGYNFNRTDVLGVILMVGACIAWGVLFGWTRMRTGSVWPAVFGHGALNAGGGMVMLFVVSGETPDMGVVGPLGLVSWGVLAVVVAILAATGQFRREVLG
ncbi:CPBP family intramembrane metalloprotease [Tessaracoccus terricola]